MIFTFQGFPGSNSGTRSVVNADDVELDWEFDPLFGQTSLLSSALSGHPLSERAPTLVQVLKLILIIKIFQSGSILFKKMIIYRGIK